MHVLGFTVLHMTISNLHTRRVFSCRGEVCVTEFFSCRGEVCVGVRLNYVLSLHWPQQGPVHCVCQMDKHAAHGIEPVSNLCEKRLQAVEMGAYAFVALSFLVSK